MQCSYILYEKINEASSQNMQFAPTAFINWSKRWNDDKLWKENSSVVHKVMSDVTEHYRTDLGILRPPGHIRPFGWPWPARVRLIENYKIYIFSIFW